MTTDPEEQSVGKKLFEAIIDYNWVTIPLIALLIVFPIVVLIFGNPFS